MELIGKHGKQTDWLCTDMGNFIHVHPASDESHNLENDCCWCSPQIEKHDRVIVIHNNGNA